MNVHCINILLFALPLNILEYKINKPHITPRHTHTNRSLCECELYALANYDNDPQMKEVMDNFNKQTQQRFEKYDDRMVDKRKECKDKCDKEIQKIILKDKLEKQMEKQLTTLEAKIDTNDIPTCVCEKSIADKMEKGCLRCAGVLGGTLPELGLMGGTALYTLSQLKPAALFAATKYAMAQGLVKGVSAGNTLGMKIVTAGLRALGVEELGIKSLESFFPKGYIIDVSSVAKTIADKHGQICAIKITNDASTMCEQIGAKIGTHLPGGKYGPPAKDAVTPKLEGILGKAKLSAGAEASEVISTTSSNIITEETALIEGGFNSTITSIYAAIIAIVVIVLIMVIIYLILRYRRKKKMKKKLQYIKLLEE
ncbi:rifin [Plasmodium reichenowi]|uniref:Rifin n=1 Tax=Plasmodium reichenowi TaxID=5854 RepID=A0A060RMR6_PLARE|nr:rifin [Plasmodium reichenowi]